MTAKTTKPLCILSDANIIIESHKLGIWKHLIEQCQMCIPQHIEKNEATYFKSKDKRKTINLKEQIDNGKINILAATREEIGELYKIFEEWWLKPLGNGELEALAIILSGKFNRDKFCTSDGPAIKTLAMLGKSDLGISFEKLLERTGFKGSSKRLPFWFLEGYFKKCIREGCENYVTRTGLVNKTIR